LRRVGAFAQVIVRVADPRIVFATAVRPNMPEVCSCTTLPARVFGVDLHSPVGWQPSRLLAGREAERAFPLVPAEDGRFLMRPGPSTDQAAMAGWAAEGAVAPGSRRPGSVCCFYVRRWFCDRWNPTRAPS
jgi:hypothetical protein